MDIRKALEEITRTIAEGGEIKCHGQGIAVPHERMVT